MSVSAHDLRAIATAAQATAESPTSAARQARRYVDQHKDEVVRAARSGKLSIEFEWQGLPQTLTYILTFFREDFPGVEVYPRILLNEKGVSGSCVVVSWA